MGFKSLEENLHNEYGKSHLVDGELCDKIVVLNIEQGYKIQPGEYYLPRDYQFPDVAYKAIELGRNRGKRAVEVKDRKILRDLCLLKYFNSSHSNFDPDDLDNDGVVAIEIHYARHYDA